MTSSRRITVLAIVCMAASLIIALVTAARIYGPSIRPDEWGYLLNGQVLLGQESGHGYFLRARRLSVVQWSAVVRWCHHPLRGG